MRCEAIQLRILDRFIGDLPLESVHMGNLQDFIRIDEGKESKPGPSIMRLQVVTAYSQFGMRVNGLTKTA